MEVSAANLSKLSNRPLLGGKLLALRSDEQLIELFRAGREDAFTVIYDRYRQRLFAFIRQMLSGDSQDAEDTLQEVFIRAHKSLLTDDRKITLKAWLYQIAYNRCIDHVRRNKPDVQELFDISHKPLQDPVAQAERKQELKRLVEDIRGLPEQQRSALLMRELDGLSYDELASALDVTVASVKSLLVRARMGLAEVSEARDTPCEEIMFDITDAHERGVKINARALKHLRECETCVEYRNSLKQLDKRFAALFPMAVKVGLAAKLAGFFGISSGGATAGGTVAVSGSVKAISVACCAFVTAGGAIEAKHTRDNFKSDKSPQRISDSSFRSQELPPNVAPIPALIPNSLRDNPDVLPNSQPGDNPFDPNGLDDPNDPNSRNNSGLPTVTDTPTTETPTTDTVPENTEVTPTTPDTTDGGGGGTDGGGNTDGGGGGTPTETDGGGNATTDNGEPNIPTVPTSNRPSNSTTLGTSHKKNFPFRR